MISVKIANKDSEELLPYFNSPVIKGWNCRPGPHFCRLAMLPLRVSILNGSGYGVPFVQFYLIIKSYYCCAIADKSNSKRVVQNDVFLIMALLTPPPPPPKYACIIYVVDFSVTCNSCKFI